MRPALALALACAVVAALSLFGASTRVPRPSPLAAPHGSAATPSASAPSSPCPPNTLPDDGVCVPVPRRAEPPRGAAIGVPLGPDRAPDYARYHWPVAGAGTAMVVEAARGADGGPARAGVLLHVPPGTGVVALALEGQDGRSAVLYAGPLVGNSIVTRHTVSLSGRRQEFVAILGELSQVAAVAAGKELAGGSELGKAGDRPMYFETRLVRPGVDAKTLAGPEALDDALTVSVDPRNVLRPR